MNVVLSVVLCALAAVCMIALIKSCGKAVFDNDSVGRWWGILTYLLIALPALLYISLYNLGIISGNVDYYMVIDIFAIGIILGLLVW